MLLLAYLYLYVACSIVVCIAADSRFNRDAGGWLALSLLLTPVLTAPLLTVIGPRRPARAMALDRAPAPARTLVERAVAVASATRRTE